MEKNTKLNGTWENGVFRLIIKRNKYVSLYNGFRYGKGTILYDNENFTLTSTHAYWKFFLWTPFVEVVKGKYKLEIELTVSGVEGRYSEQNGVWTMKSKNGI